MQIRRMEARDLDEVMRLEQEIFSEPWSRQSMQREFDRESNIYLTADMDGEVAGYCCVWRSFECADLCNIAVAPERRRRGVASALLDEAVRLCRCSQVEKMFLEVRVSNTPAINFYEKKNFQAIHTREKYYRNPIEDALVMQRCV